MNATQIDADAAPYEFADGNPLSSASWQQRYREGRGAWDRGEPNPALLEWLDCGELDRGRIVVPGCGRGHEVVELANRGFEVTAIDFAPTPILFLHFCLRGRGLTADLRQHDVLTIELDRKFDAVYEQTCLCAIHPDTWRSYETQLASWLKPGGKLFALFIQSNSYDRPPYNCDLAAMKELFVDERWHWPSDTKVVPHPTGMDEIGAILTRRS